MDKSDNDGTTSVISISSTNINDCKDVANTLAKCGIMCSVTSNYTVRRDAKSFSLENGCNIILTGLKSDKIEEFVWKPLQKEYDLGCAYMNIHGMYKGCILNFIRPSSCPGKQD